MQKIEDQQTRSEPKARLTEQVKMYLRAGEYSRALDCLRRTEVEGDPELSELEQRAEDGLQRKGEADRLITQSQELFAQRKSGEAIQLLRQAYELDKHNSLARAILSNALVEHAQSIVEADWLQAEKLANEALKLNPAHPTAKTIQNQIVEQKSNSSVDDWVAHAQKLQSSGDLFAALAWVAEGLAVHPDDAKLLQIQDAIQRDQSARRRQARRGDLEDLRRMQQEIDKAREVAAKQALAERVQGLAAKYWTDGEILSIANALLLRLGLVPQGSSGASPHNKGAAVIFHVPRPSAPEPSRAEVSQPPPVPVVPSRALPKQAPPPAAPSGSVSTDTTAHRKVPVKVEQTGKAESASAEGKVEPPVKIVDPPKLQLTPPQAAIVLPPKPFPEPAKAVSQKSRPKRAPRFSATSLIVLASAFAAIILVFSFLFARKHDSSSAAKTSSLAPAVSGQAADAPSVPVPVTAETASQVTQTTPEPSATASDVSSDHAAEEVPAPSVSPVESSKSAGTLVVVTGQDGARVSLNGKPQRQLTKAGLLRLPSVEAKDYVVEVTESGFQDAPAQKVRVRSGEEVTVTFNLQPQLHLASLTIQGGAPGTTVFVDQALAGTVQGDGTLSVSSVSPGDHTIELRKERFKPRQFKKHFVAGGAVSLTPADAALEAAPGELRMTFSPSNANVAIAKGDVLKIVSSGVPLSLAAGTYTLTARTAERFTRSATIEVVAGQSKTLDLSLAPNGMSKWEDPGAWKQEKDAFIHKGGDFVLYGDGPALGTFVFSAMPKGHLLQWVLNYTDPKNYVLLGRDEKNFYRSVMRNGQKSDEIIVPHKGDKKSFRTFQIRVSRTEIVHEIKDGESWSVLDRWTQPGVNLSAGKFGFYLPGSEQVELSNFAHYTDLNVR